jgi:hypothetical protein
MKMTSTDALMHQVQTRPRRAAFIFHSRRGSPPFPTVRPAPGERTPNLRDRIMRNPIRTIVLLALLGNRATIAQTVGSATSSAGPASTTAPPSLMKTTRLIGGAPVGHRQPHARDIPSENASDIEHISEEDAAIDRKLIICRGCRSIS